MYGDVFGFDGASQTYSKQFNGGQPQYENENENTGERFEMQSSEFDGKSV